MVHATFPIDGPVAGIWQIRSDEVIITAFRRLTADEAGPVRDEAARLLEFLDPGPDARVVLR